METKLSLISASSHRISKPHFPEPKLIFAENPRPGIFNEIEAVYELFDGVNQGTISLKYLNGRYENHYFWAWKTREGESYLPIFKDDYVPRNIYNRKLTHMEEYQFFEYKNRLYVILMALDDTLHIEELEIHTTSAEAKAMAKADGMDNAEIYVAKAYLIAHNNKAYDFIGYCWRALTDDYENTLPIFNDDYSRIIRANPNDLYFEEVPIGEKILHNGILWEICQTEESGIYLAQKSVPMQIITNNIINP